MLIDQGIDLNYNLYKFDINSLSISQTFNTFSNNIKSIQLYYSIATSYKAKNQSMYWQRKKIHSLNTVKHYKDIAKQTNTIFSAKEIVLSLSKINI